MSNVGFEASAPTGSQPNKPVRLNQKNTFVNNNNTATISGKVVQEKQALSKILRPKADN